MNAPQIFKNFKMIKGLKGKVLWTNPNPELHFNVCDVILELYKYDVIGIWFWRNTTCDALQEIRIKKGTGGSFVYVENGSTYFQSRGVINFENTLHFYEGYLNTTVDNSRAIPQYIVGYKTGLF